MRLDHRKTFVVINFLFLMRPEIIIKEFIILRHQVLQDRFRCILVQGLLSQEMKIEKGQNSNADIYKKAVDHEFINTGGYSAEFYGWTAKTANIGTSIRQIPYTFYILCCVNSVN